MKPATACEQLQSAGYVFDETIKRWRRKWVADFLARSAGEASKLESNPGNGAMGSVQVQGRIGRRFLVRVTSFRRRLLDEDNLCEKYHVDLCRYAGALPGDEAGRTKIEVCQEKVGPKEQERTLIEIYEI